MNDVSKFADLINESKKILITSHISPDPDAVASLLLIGSTLQKNFPKKQITMVLEEEPLDLRFLRWYEQIKFMPLVDALNKDKPDLFIGLDGNNYNRFSRHNGENVRQIIKAGSIKSAAVDHHEQAGMDQLDVYINHGYPATVHDIYESCFNKLQLKKPEGFAETTMLGLYSDTGGFVYMKDGHHSEVFKLADELVTQGANIEKIKSLLSRYSENDMRVLSELCANVSHEHDYTYSFIQDEFINNWLSEGKKQSGLQSATGIFLDSYIRNIGGRQWGFIVYRNTLQGKDIYSVSFRALGGVKDVSKIANLLGGGGHKPAAAGKFQAPSIKEALVTVKQAIKQES